MSRPLARRSATSFFRNRIMACFFRRIGAIRVRMHLKACLLHPSWNRQTNQRLVKPNPRTEAAFLAQVKQTQPNRREHGGRETAFSITSQINKSEEKAEKKKESRPSKENIHETKEPEERTNESHWDREQSKPRTKKPSEEKAIFRYHLL